MSTASNPSNVPAPAWTLTTPFHKAPYPAISPSRLELSQAGKTVLITGGNAGIGYAIATAFLEASAAKVIITGRREGATRDAAASLTAAAANPGGKAVGVVCDVGDALAIDALWKGFEKEGTGVDVLVLNAVKVADAKPLLESGLGDVWSAFDVNVRAQLQMVERFYKQKQEGRVPKNLVNVSTFAIHDHLVAADRPAYGLTKSAAALALQLIAQDTSPETMQIVSMNPGAVLTEAAKGAGYDEESFAWNSPDLPGRFAVWCASPEAAFLHGRFIWCEWDVDEIKSGEIRKRIEEDPFYLKVGVRGL
ncbi:hypothetical protein DPSP01_005323 [Paraphaeosphaeria sporulosa]